MILSRMPFLFFPEYRPRTMAMRNPRSILVPIRITVAGRRSSICVRTGRLFIREFPKFPCIFGFPLKIFSLFGSLSMISFARVNNTTPSKNATIQAATLIEFINIKSLLKISLLTMVDDTLCLLLTSRQRSNRDNSALQQVNLHPCSILHHMQVQR